VKEDYIVALFACKECGENVSTKAKACPHCGNPVKKRTFVQDSVFALVIIFIFFSIIVTLRPNVALLNDTTKEMAINSIKEYPEIIEAIITQKGDDLSLVLIVPENTSIKKAKDLGDNFVRKVKSFAKDAPDPGKKIGKGIYSYLVSVYTKQEKKIVLGAKVQTAENITW